MGVTPSNENGHSTVSCGVSGLMGAAMMALDIKMYSMGGLGVFVFPSLIGPDGNLSKVILPLYCHCGWCSCLPHPTLCTSTKSIRWWAAKVEEKAEEEAPAPKEIQQEIIASPLIGNVVPLDQVPDQVFASRGYG